MPSSANSGNSNDRQSVREQEAKPAEHPYIRKVVSARRKMGIHSSDAALLVAAILWCPSQHSPPLEVWALMNGYHKVQLLMLAIAAAGWIAIGGDDLNGSAKLLNTQSAQTPKRQSLPVTAAAGTPTYTPCPKQNAAHKWLEIEVAQGCPGKHCTIYCQYEGAKLMTRDEARL